MPRRPPPTSLKLRHGPLPARGEPKHTLPSLPHPIFCPTNIVTSLKSALKLRTMSPFHPVSDTETSPASSNGRDSAPVGSPPSTSPLGLPPTNPTSSTRIVAPLGTSKRRGPWDYSVLGPVLDVDSILPPPKPVATNG